MDELTSFGNYLLSKEREERISEINKRNVTYADYENWKVKNISNDKIACCGNCHLPLEEIVYVSKTKIADKKYNP